MIDLVRRKRSKTSDEHVSLPRDFQPEPNLLPDSNHLLPSFFNAKCQQSSPEHMSKRVARNPRDLRAHAQRILVLEKRDDADACYAALVDLFAVLGTRGLELRRNLLDKCHGTISPSQFDSLYICLEKGLLAKNVAAMSPLGSQLHNGVSGTLEIVKLRNVTPRQQQLEAAVVCDPGDETACKNLLMLYRKNRDLEAFTRIFSTVMGKRIAVPELWQETETILKAYA